MSTLRRIREKFELSQAEMAEAIGFNSVQAVSYKENHPQEKDRLTMDQVHKIRAYVEGKGHRWPSRFSEELMKPIEIERRGRGRPRKPVPEGETA